MPRIHLSTVLILLVASTLGCDSGTAPPSSRPANAGPFTAAQRNELRDAVARSEREAQNTIPPSAKITLATPAGWTRSKVRPLPPSDNGFSVAYEHESGLAVTLFQYTRGLAVVPEALDSTALQEEMQGAKDGIQQAAQAGYWQVAKEVESGIVPLGDSSMKALWSQYQLTANGMTFASDIYMWSHSNTFFKLRCTCRNDDVRSNQEVLHGLLTALGSPVAHNEKN